MSDHDIRWFHDWSDKRSRMLSKAMEDYYSRAVLEVMQNRERYLQAWIAETGCLPSEAELCQQTDADGTIRIWVQRREPLPR